MWLVKPTLETRREVKVEDNDIIVTCRDCVLLLRPWKSESKVKYVRVYYLHKGKKYKIGNFREPFPDYIKELLEETEVEFRPQ
jgi:hypothetical protein